MLLALLGLSRGPLHTLNFLFFFFFWFLFMITTLHLWKFIWTSAAILLSLAIFPLHPALASWSMKHTTQTPTFVLIARPTYRVTYNRPCSVFFASSSHLETIAFFTWWSLIMLSTTVETRIFVVVTFRVRYMCWYIRLKKKKTRHTYR